MRRRRGHHARRRGRRQDHHARHRRDARAGAASCRGSAGEACCPGWARTAAAHRARGHRGDHRTGGHRSDAAGRRRGHRHRTGDRHRDGGRRDAGTGHRRRPRTGCCRAAARADRAWAPGCGAARPGRPADRRRPGHRRAATAGAADARDASPGAPPDAARASAAAPGRRAPTARPGPARRVPAAGSPDAARAWAAAVRARSRAWAGPSGRRRYWSRARVPPARGPRRLRAPGRWWPRGAAPGDAGSVADRDAARASRPCRGRHPATCGLPAPQRWRTRTSRTRPCPSTWRVHPCW